MKLCKDCGETKPLTDFYKNGQGGCLSYCKPCNKVRSVTWQKAYRERANAIA